jgi:hypothetical protein
LPHLRLTYMYIYIHLVRLIKQWVGEVVAREAI